MTDNKCSICHEEILNNSGYTIPECGHDSFHANCIIQWFRKGSDRCPLCNDIGTSHPCPRLTINEFIKSAKKVAKDDNAPKLLVITMQKLNKAEIELKKIKKEIQIHKTSEGIFRDLMKKQRQLWSRHWKKQTRVIELKRTIQAMFAITNLIIVTKKEIK